MDLAALTREYSGNFPDDAEGVKLIAKAYDFAREIHRGQKRASGADYFTHVLDTAFQLAQWKLDAQTVAAGLLHDSLEDCDVTPKQLSSPFGEDVLFLVEGVTKLSTLKYRGQERSVESLRKMILAISRDLRVIFIKLADRRHNMRTLVHLPEDKRRRIALETSEVYAPLASRLGMQNLAGELEDLAFPYTHPEQYEWISKNLREPYEERNEYLQHVHPLVQAQLEKVGITPVRIDYRAKRISSLYKKLLRYDMNIDHIYDLVAMRIMVSTVDECYLALGAIHQLWRPMPGRIKDYIALPKTNGYQSLHTTVFCEGNRPAEFQIRTMAMHEQAENGAAAHWFYETQKGTKQYIQGKAASADAHHVAIVRQLKEWQEHFPGSEEFINALKVDLFSDRIFVLTPQGEALDLPVGSTPVDFAYRIHSEIGGSCIGAKVNNKIVPLDHQLQSGDIVEVLTQKGKKPSEAWMRFVKTKYALKKIKLSFKKKTAIPKKTEYKITCLARVGMLKDITSVLSRNHVIITSIHSVENEKYPHFRIVTDINSRDRAEQVLVKLRKLPDIKELSCKLID
jgi:GTP pyrophosphokinase